MYQTLPALFKEERLPGVALLAIAVAEFGTDCFDWEPEILRANLSDELNIEITDRQSDKLQAAITVISTPRRSKFIADVWRKVWGVTFFL